MKSFIELAQEFNKSSAQVKAIQWLQASTGAERQAKFALCWRDGRPGEAIDFVDVFTHYKGHLHQNIALQWLEDTSHFKTANEFRRLWGLAQEIVASEIDWNNNAAMVSEFFTVGEVTQGDRRRIPIRGSQEESNILRLAKELDAVRRDWGSSIGVTSWYRPPAVNWEVGGVSNSQHILGSAVDIYPKNGRDREFEQFLDRGWGGALGYGQAAGRGFTHLDLRGGGWKHGNGSIRWNY